jgi:hypothetical protein
MAWDQEMCEHVVGHAPALRDALALVEGPVDTEIDAALPIFFFSFRKRREAALHHRPHGSIVVLSHTIKLVRHERKLNAIGSIVLAQYLE